MPKYVNIDEYIELQDVSLRLLLSHIHKTIMLAHEQMREKIAWNLPFFQCGDYLCYLSVIKKTKAVEVCFVKGFHLSNESGLLDAKDRKLIKGISFKNLEDYEQKEEAFLEILQEAILLNETQPDLKFYNMIVTGRTGKN